jgi:hypothetical protein
MVAQGQREQCTVLEGVVAPVAVGQCLDDDPVLVAAVLPPEDAFELARDIHVVRQADDLRQAPLRRGPALLLIAGGDPLGEPEKPFPPRGQRQISAPPVLVLLEGRLLQPVLNLADDRAHPFRGDYLAVLLEQILDRPFPILVFSDGDEYDAGPLIGCAIANPLHAVTL